MKKTEIDPIIWEKAEVAAVLILDELSDRKGIGHEIDNFDDEIRAEIEDSIAEIIYTTMKTKDTNEK